MPTQYSDQFFVMDPANPPGVTDPLTVQNFNFIDEDDDGDISPGDTFNGDVITAVWVGDSVTMFVPGTGNITISGVTFYVENQPAVFTATDGTILEDGTYVSSTFVNGSTQIPVGDLLPTCFTPGTMIDTIDGLRAVEDICRGDLVRTADCGYQPVVLVSRCKVAAQGRYAPIRIVRGALGNTRDLIVSPQHRILVEGWAAELFTGQESVLVPACHLVDGHKVHVLEGGDVEYIHLGFSGHALVQSEGIWTESHFSSVAGRVEAEALFPGCTQPAQLARPAARKHESSLIAAYMLS